jgi:predicted lipid-binding transport protein (Tim44 family)
MQTVSDLKYRGAYDALVSLIQDAYGEKRYLLDSEQLSAEDRSYFLRILRGREENGKKTPSNDYRISLKKLTEFLRKDSGKRVVVRIDE